MVLRRSARHCQKGFNTRKITAPLLNKCLTNQMPRIKFQTRIPPSIPHGRTVPSRFGILRPPLEFNWLINAQIVTYIYEISLSPSIFAGKGGRTGIVTRQGHYFSATDTTRMMKTHLIFEKTADVPNPWILALIASSSWEFAHFVGVRSGNWPTFHDDPRAKFSRAFPLHAQTRFIFPSLLVGDTALPVCSYMWGKGILVAFFLCGCFFVFLFCFFLRVFSVRCSPCNLLLFFACSCLHISFEFLSIEHKFQFL